MLRRGSLPAVPWWVPGEIHEALLGQCQGLTGWDIFFFHVREIHALQRCGRQIY